MADNTLHLAELYHQTGEISARYARILSEDGTRWIRHGLYTAYHTSGHVMSTGNYINGLEEGVWQDFYENGQKAAEGEYRSGKEHGTWRFWSQDGVQSESIYIDGVEQ